MGEGLVYLLLSFGVLILLAIIGRQYVCWYFKINDNVELLREQNKILKQLLAQQTAAQQNEQDKNIAEPQKADSEIKNS